ncbi:hypothetical protein BT67DRAFT_34428 [Trichocladium antarcticum]|uniref:Uncharacterized protein n=1 Tax=Trichocladium antarcticum TaxID=1450529 RepID=A0AAN6UJH9_9PEZI|nr:hypothetical protein BT67DRAFT_34428 [Trichocladium antarcticum]
MLLAWHQPQRPTMFRPTRPDLTGLYSISTHILSQAGLPPSPRTRSLHLANNDSIMGSCSSSPDKDRSKPGTHGPSSSAEFLQPRPAARDSQPHSQRRYEPRKQANLKPRQQAKAKPGFRLELVCTGCPAGRCTYANDKNFNKAKVYSTTLAPRGDLQVWRVRLDLCDWMNMRGKRESGVKAKGILEQYLPSSSNDYDDYGVHEKRKGRGADPICMEEVMGRLEGAGVVSRDTTVAWSSIL